MSREYGGRLIDMHDAIDLHWHSYPDLFPRLADDIDVAIAARNAGMRAMLIKAHHENTVTRAYLVNRVVPGIRMYGGIVLNSYVGGINPAAVEAVLRLGGKEVWMPTIDAGYHAQLHGGTGRYDVQQGGRGGEGIWILDHEQKVKPEVCEVLSLVAEYNVILGTAHLSPAEILALVKKARELKVQKILITHPFFKVPGLDLDTLEELIRLGGMAEFGYCTISPAWHYATPEQKVNAIRRIGASRSVLMSDTGQRHNPLPSEALRIFAQTLFEKGLEESDIRRMTVQNPRDLLEPELTEEPIEEIQTTWVAACGTNAHVPTSAVPELVREQR
jgi:Family of unknown function (DUF6282)